MLCNKVKICIDEVSGIDKMDCGGTSLHGPHFLHLTWISHKNLLGRHLDALIHSLLTASMVAAVGKQCHV